MQSAADDGMGEEAYRVYDDEHIPSPTKECAKFDNRKIYAETQCSKKK